MYAERMNRVKHKELREVIMLAYERQISLFIWGTTGIGKSYTVRETAKELARRIGRPNFVEWNRLTYDEKLKVYNEPEKYFVLIDIRLSQVDASDVRGLPKLNERHVVWKPPLWLDFCTKRQARGIVFLDELNLAPPTIQASAYQLILDRSLGEYAIADGIGVIGAGNRLEDRANVFEMPKPLQNRFIHVELMIPTAEEWIENFAIPNKLDSRIIMFIQKRPSLLFKFNPKSKDERFPTPRSWEFASKLIKGIPTERLEWIGKLVAMAVGDGASAEFVSFLKFYERLPDIKLLIQGKAEVPQEPDLLYVLTAQIVEYFRNHKDEKTLRGLAKNVLAKMPDEFAILSLKMMKSEDEKTIRSTAKLPEWRPLYMKFLKYLL